MAVPVPLVDIGAGALEVSCDVLKATVHHGRDDPTTQPDASTATIELVGVLPPAAVIGARVRLRAVLGGATFDRFAGTITDLGVEWDDVDTPRPRIIAASDLGRLGRVMIGATPWPAELDGARATRVLTEAGYPPDPLLTDPGRVGVLARDVDRQPALAVATDAALDGGGVLWNDRSGRILYADAEHRRGAVAELELEACDIGAAAAWAIGLEGLVNDVFVRYGPEPPGGGDQAEYHASSPTSIAERGTYGASLTTRIADAIEAQKRADAIVARQADPAWLLGPIELELALADDARAAVILGLEVHDLVRVTALPAGSPATTVDQWVEGWRETIEPDELGLSWRLELATSDYCRTAAYARWDDVGAAITWASIDPALTWNAIACLPRPPSAGRWNDVPASLRWDTADPAMTWDTWEG